ncbi:hypothetical protein HID58_004550 [Brassica napus]|uniref:Uncharacterized protein n=1 Tax=Brassica napus TaxID=3708 RepID=A0ABQ8E647_BRANA|nr:hypothetical protein HID58_004550 [Brassica napus]
MSICVRFWRGEWKKNGEDEWHFQPDDDDFGLRTMIKDDETYETLEAMVRRRYSLRPSTPVVLTFRLPTWMLSPLGHKTPPTTITRTEDLCVLLNVRTSLSDLALLVTAGPKCVAEYEFLCRTSFTIGSTTYVVDNTQNEASRAEYETLVYGDRATQTERVMDALFPEDALRLFHRVSCEMAYADQWLANQSNNNGGSREIIVVDDDDDVMYEANPVNLEIGESSRGGGGGSLQPNMVYSPAMTQSQAPPILWDVGMDLGNHQSPTNPQNLHSTLENDMRFWEGVIAAGVQVDGQLNINAVNDDEMQNLGGIISLAGANDHVIGEGVDHDVLPNVCVENAVVQAEGGGSSTGSNREGKQLGGGMLGAKPFEEDDFCPGEETAQGSFEAEGMQTQNGAGDVPVLAAGVVEETTPTVVPPLFSLTKGEHTAGTSGVRQGEKCLTETSSEASETEGGF